jgi:hypothetical protein
LEELDDVVLNRLLWLVVLPRPVREERLNVVVVVGVLLQVLMVPAGTEIMHAAWVE